jgi:hypothetical protein
MPHPNLMKAEAAYDLQASHLRYWVEQFVTQKGWRYLSRVIGYDFGPSNFARLSIPDTHTLYRLCRATRMMPMELCGTACTRAECAQWHTDPDDR